MEAGIGIEGRHSQGPGATPGGYSGRRSAGQHRTCYFERVRPGAMCLDV